MNERLKLKLEQRRAEREQQLCQMQKLQLSKPRKARAKINNSRIGFKLPISMRQDLETICTQKKTKLAKLIRHVLRLYITQKQETKQ